MRSGPGAFCAPRRSFFGHGCGIGPDSACHRAAAIPDQGATNSGLAGAAEGSGGASMDRHRKPVRLTPPRRVYVLGAILLVALAICSRKFSSLGAPAFMVPLAVAAIAYLVALREVFSTERFPKRVVVIGLGLAAVWQVLFLVQPPGSDDDIHRYVWDGRVQRLG